MLLSIHPDIFWEEPSPVTQCQENILEVFLVVDVPTLHPSQLTVNPKHSVLIVPPMSRWNIWLRIGLV